MEHRFEKLRKDPDVKGKYISHLHTCMHPQPSAGALRRLVLKDPSLRDKK